MRVLAASIALAILGCAGTARDNPCTRIPHTFTEAFAVRTLRTAPRVWPDGWGFAGAPSCYAASFRFLLTQQGSEKAFERLARAGSPAGRLYGLAGLRHTNSNRFEALAQDSFFTSGSQVEVIYGCVVQERPVEDFVARIRAGNLEQFLGAV